MACYDVPVVERKNLPLWLDYNSSLPSKKAIKANSNAKLGQTVFIEARSIDEAVGKIELIYPNHFIDKEGIICL